jgi:signal transduction histidine kinase
MSGRETTVLYVGPGGAPPSGTSPDGRTFEVVGVDATGADADRFTDAGAAAADAVIVRTTGEESAVALLDEVRAARPDLPAVLLADDASPSDAVAVAGALVDGAVEADRERTLERLHAATRDLIRAGTPGEVAEHTVRTAEEVLDHTINGVRLLTDDRAHLEMVAHTEHLPGSRGEPPVYPVGEGTAGRALAAGEPLVVEDVTALDDGYDRASIRSAMYLPLGSHGTLSVGRTSDAGFSPSEVHLAKMLAANAEAALDRIAQSQDLRDQNERLEEFATIVSHDLRNPLNVATGWLDLALEDGDVEHVEKARAALDRMDDLIEDVLALARQGQTVVEPEPVALEPVVEQAWRTAAATAPGATLVVEGDLGTVLCDRSRLSQLLENLFRNSIEHGSTGSRAEPGDSAERGSTGSRAEPGDSAEHGDDVTVRVGTTEASLYVADDGPGIPPGERDRVFDSGYTTADDGTGFGLAIVRQIAEAHRWQVAVTESDAGGARVEVTGVQWVPDSRLDVDGDEDAGTDGDAHGDGATDADGDPGADADVEGDGSE